jgi:hypothetical protein
MQVMRDAISVFVRVASIAWGCLELSGFLWFYDSRRAALVSLYWLVPAVALITLAIVPSKMWDNNLGRLMLFALALGAIFRSIHIGALDVLASTGPDMFSAMLRMITVVLVLLLVGVGVKGRPILKRSSWRSDSSSTS